MLSVVVCVQCEDGGELICHSQCTNDGECGYMECSYCHLWCHKVCYGFESSQDVTDLVVICPACHEEEDEESEMFIYVGKKNDMKNKKKYFFKGECAVIFFVGICWHFFEKCMCVLLCEIVRHSHNVEYKDKKEKKDKKDNKDKDKKHRKDKKDKGKDQKE